MSIAAIPGQILVYESPTRKITFEFDKVLPNDFVVAKKWCNSIALTNGNFPEYMFNGENVRYATDEEEQEYNQLKIHSQWQFNAE